MQLTAEDVAHLLRRAGFGGTAAQVAAWAGQEDTTVVDAVLDTAANPAETRPGILDTAGPNEDRWQRLLAVRNGWIDRMATTPTPVVEKMTLFWHGLFTTSSDSVYRPNALYQQLTFYRANALGNLRVLAQGMAVQPAMLLYLNNNENRKRSPNQNFARELLELFLLGVGNYTEADVIAAAAAWTGHTVTENYEYDTATYTFRADWHDTADKTFMGVTRNWNGPEIIDHLLDNAATRTVVARYIVTKMWTHFAAPDPSATVVNALADVLLANNWNLRPLVRALFLRPEFYGTAVKQGLVRTPIEYVVAVMKARQMSAADLHPEWWLNDMGQEPYNPPNVSGWRPNGYWVSAAASSARARFADWLTWRLRDANFLADSPTKSRPDAIAAALAAFHVHHPSARLVAVLDSWLATQRAAGSGQTWAENKVLPLLVLLSPDIQLA
jgi:uncharacterized protein (DUF1800 family)